VLISIDKLSKHQSTMFFNCGALYLKDELNSNQNSG
jgi:hypothetical protein